jgi:hypothetical protein
MYPKENKKGGGYTLSTAEGTHRKQFVLAKKASPEESIRSDPPPIREAPSSQFGLVYYLRPGL